MAATFELYQDTQGQHRFRLKAGNGEIVSDSQAYASADAAREGMYALKRAAVEAHVPGDEAISGDTGIHMHY